MSDVHKKLWKPRAHATFIPSQVELVSSLAILGIFAQDKNDNCCVLVVFPSRAWLFSSALCTHTLWLQGKRSFSGLILTISCFLPWNSHIVDSTTCRDDGEFIFLEKTIFHREEGNCCLAFKRIRSDSQELDSKNYQCAAWSYWNCLFFYQSFSLVVKLPT